MRKIKLLAGILTVMMGTSVYANTISVNINNNPFQTEVAPIQQNGTTFVPLRDILEELGAEVQYDQATQIATVIKGDESVVVEKPYLIIGGRTMVPIRMLSEGFGATVNWDGVNKVISINMPQEEVVPETPEIPEEVIYPEVTINIQGYGAITAELYPELAPNTVNNFLSLAEEGFYDGLVFHRVIEDFMIQGGCPDGTGSGNPGYSIEGEFINNGYEENTLSHTEGVLSMARTQYPNSAGSQFFIMTSTSPHLDSNYAAFGKIVDGLDLAMTIQSVDTNSADRPKEDIIIESIQVETYGVEYPEPIKVEW